MLNVFAVGCLVSANTNNTEQNIFYQTCWIEVSTAQCNIAACLFICWNEHFKWLWRINGSINQSTTIIMPAMLQSSGCQFYVICSRLFFENLWNAEDCKLIHVPMVIIDGLLVGTLRTDIKWMCWLIFWHILYWTRHTLSVSKVSRQTRSKWHIKRTLFLGWCIDQSWHFQGLEYAELKILNGCFRIYADL